MAPSSSPRDDGHSTTPSGMGYDAPASFTRRRMVFSRAALMSDTALLAYLALASFVAHMLVAGNYGYFGDELYYMAGGRHLAFGYVDFPP